MGLLLTCLEWIARLIFWLARHWVAMTLLVTSVAVGWLTGPFGLVVLWLLLIGVPVLWAHRWPGSWSRWLGRWLLRHWHRWLCWCWEWRLGTRPAVRPTPMGPGVQRAVSGECPEGHVIREAAALCDECGTPLMAFVDPAEPARVAWLEDDLEVGT